MEAILAVALLYNAFCQCMLQKEAWILDSYETKVKVQMSYD